MSEPKPLSKEERSRLLMLVTEVNRIPISAQAFAEACDRYEATVVAAETALESKRNELGNLVHAIDEMFPCPNDRLYGGADNCPCACHVFPIDRLKHAELRAEKLAEMLAAVQWVTVNTDGAQYYDCPVCYNSDQEGHTTSCELAELLGGILS